MSLTAKVNAAVDSAFAAAGDLVRQATLSKKTVSGYDFSTGSTISTSSTATVDVIIQSKENPAGNGFTVKALMKSTVSLSVYDTLTVGTESYNISSYNDNGFIIEAIIVKER